MKRLLQELFYFSTININSLAYIVQLENSEQSGNLLWNRKNCNLRKCWRNFYYKTATYGFCFGIQIQTICERMSLRVLLAIKSSLDWDVVYESGFFKFIIITVYVYSKYIWVRSRGGADLFESKNCKVKKIALVVSKLEISYVPSLDVSC